MPAHDIAPDELSQRVDERKKFLTEVVPFLNEIILRYGTVVESRVCDSHTNTILRLDAFGTFSYRADFCQNMMGGNTIEVYYLPTASDPSKVVGIEVLRLYSQTDVSKVDEIRVEKFDNDWTWQAALRELMRDKAAASALYEKSLRDHVAERKAHAEREEKKIKLQAEAKRLGL